MDALPLAPTKPAIPAAFFGETVTWVHHWTDRQFSFRCTRSPTLRFVAGQFAMIGLMVEGKPLVRAYSMVSPPWDEELAVPYFYVEWRLALRSLGLAGCETASGTPQSDGSVRPARLSLEQLRL